MALSEQSEQRVFDAVQSLKSIITNNFNPDTDITKSMLGEITTIEEVYLLVEDSVQSEDDAVEDTGHDPLGDEKLTKEIPAKLPNMQDKDSEESNDKEQEK